MRWGPALASLGTVFLSLPSVAGPARAQGKATAHSQEKITVRLLDYRTQKPLKKVAISVILYSGNAPGIPAQEVAWSGVLRTDASGEIVLRVPHPLPEHLNIYPTETLYTGDPTLAVAAVLKSGAVLDRVPKARRPKSKPLPTAEPGLVIIVDKKMSWWDYARQEIP